MKPQTRLSLYTGVGALAGLAVWAYDYDFFLNAGGPATPISRTILRLSHLQGAGLSVTVLWPLVVLIGLGIIIGAAVGRLGMAKQ